MTRPSFLMPAAWAGRHPRLAALGAGALAALAFPPLHLVPVLLLAVPALLWLLGRAGSWKQAALLGFLWGWGQHLVGVHWVTNAILKDVANFWWLVPFAAPALAVPLALFGVPAALAAWALPPGWRRVLGFAAVYVVGELLRGWMFTGFPWNLMGSAWAFAALPVQAAALVGVHGLSLLTLVLAGLPLWPDRRAWVAGAAGVLLLAGFGAWRLAGEPPPGPAVQLVLVQGNVAQEMKWRPEQRQEIFQRYLGLTAEATRREAAAHPGRRIVAVWPESATQFLLAQDPGARQAIAAALPPEALLLAGTVRAEWGDDGRARRVWNSLAALDHRGEVLALYDKAHLVPFGEYMPLAGLLPIRLAAGGMDFSAGSGPETISLPGLPPFGALICYEVIFPGAVTPTPRPAWLVNITNDAWFGEAAGPWQHLASARLRAVEEGLPLARAAQTGISAVFDSLGRRTGFLPIGTGGTLAEALPPAGLPTPFSRLGLWIPSLMALITLGISAISWRANKLSSELFHRRPLVFIEKSQKD